MRDPEIRNILHSYLSIQNKFIKDTIIVDELNIKNGLARIDVAVINGLIHGYEIKSEADTLNRLENQIPYYNSSLEKISIVVNPKHIDKVIQKIPSWWGIIEVSGDNKISEIRKAEDNNIIDITDTLLLLWKNELIKLFIKHKIEYKKSWNRKILIESLSYNLNDNLLLDDIRQTLKLRKNWRN